MSGFMGQDHGIHERRAAAVFRVAALEFLSEFIQSDQTKVTIGTDSGTLLDSSVWKKFTWPVLTS